VGSTHSRSPSIHPTRSTTPRLRPRLSNVNQPRRPRRRCLSSALCPQGRCDLYCQGRLPAVTTDWYFCDATAALCENSAIIGRAQLTSAGTRSHPSRHRSHSYQAVFGRNTTSLKSTSSAQACGTGTFPTATAIFLFPARRQLTHDGTGCPPRAAPVCRQPEQLSFFGHMKWHAVAWLAKAGSVWRR